MIQVPPIQEDKLLPLPHFPAAYQCVIFRNWGLVPGERIARVLGTDQAALEDSAAAMGLPRQPEVCGDWLAKGYITIIRYNWHLLSYEDLCVLLDWPMERLAFVLQEDDFLEVKLGGFKPAVPDCRYRPLTEQEKEETDRIRKIVTEVSERIPPVTEKPFEFERHFGMYGREPMVLKDPRYEERFVYSYCALFGDVLADRALLDSSFPDALLEAYAALGITGVWIHIVLYNLVPYPFDETLSRGWEIRQEGLRYLTEKLDRWGLRLFLYFNEPRAMPMAFFEKRPELLGMANAAGTLGTLCVSRPEVQAYLRDSAAMLAGNIPLLGGIFTITASENLTNCYSHVAYGERTACPRCRDMTHEESFALVNRLVWEGISSVSRTVRVIAWTWGWHGECAREVIGMLPEEISVMNVSEQAVAKTIGETRTSVLDYSISVEGPGEYALGNWRRAHESGHKAYAKIQANNTWEMAAVPYVPAFEQIYRHIRRLTEAGESRPDGLMLSWSLGGCPSASLKLLSAFYEESDRIPELKEVYGKMFPGADVDMLAEAFRGFSEAFAQYPFHLGTAYQGPQEHAPANLLYEEPSGFRATMTGFPYDDLDGWRSIFPLETYLAQLKKMSDRWHEGLTLLAPLCREARDALLGELWDCAEVCDCHFRSMYLQSLFVAMREGRAVACDETMAEILREEEEISMRVAAVQARNATIGYEASNHYFYYRNVLIEKVISCRCLAERAKQREGGE